MSYRRSAAPPFRAYESERQVGYNRHYARPQPGVSVGRDSHSGLWHRHVVRA